MTNLLKVSAVDGTKPIGPYSPGIAAGGFLFISGQVGLDPQSGQLVSGGIEKQCEQALHNLGTILNAGGSSFAQVVKVEVFLKNMDDFAVLNRVYQRFFTQEPYPARCAVEVSRMPLGALVEIAATSLR